MHRSRSYPMFVSLVLVGVNRPTVRPLSSAAQCVRTSDRLFGDIMAQAVLSVRFAF